jgi:hypothetical protein
LVAGSLSNIAKIIASVRFLIFCAFHVQQMPLPLSSCVFGLLLGDPIRLNARDVKHPDERYYDPAVVTLICHFNQAQYKTLFSRFNFRKNVKTAFTSGTKPLIISNIFLNPQFYQQSIET